MVEIIKIGSKVLTTIGEIECIVRVLLLDRTALLMRLVTFKEGNIKAYGLQSGKLKQVKSN